MPDTPGAFGDIGRHPEYRRTPKLLVLRLDSPFFYANATVARDDIKRLVGASDPVPRAVVLEAGANPDLAITSVEILGQLVDSLRGLGIEYALADLRQPVVEMLRRSGLLESIGENRVYHTTGDAVQDMSRLL